jgi:hypothetical protein
MRVQAHRSARETKVLSQGLGQAFSLLTEWNARLAGNGEPPAIFFASRLQVAQAFSLRGLVEA